MMKKIIIVFLMIFVVQTVAAGPHLNEIFPAPASGDYEWIEIYNDENTSIDIAGFYLNDLANNKIKIEPVNIDGLGFIVASSSSVLNNGGDTVYLKNQNGETIDIATYSGSFDSTRVFARCPDGSGDWLTLSYGTKGGGNESSCPKPTISQDPSPTIIETVPPTPEATATVSPPSPTPSSAMLVNNIYINEIMTYPEENNQEWVELYNNNDFPVSLSGWWIDDIIGLSSSPRQFSTDIAAKSFQIITLPSNILNNDKDSVTILDSLSNVIESIEYSSSRQGSTWGRIDIENDFFCFQTPTPGQANASCRDSGITTTPTIQISSIKNSDSNTNEKSQPSSYRTFSWPTPILYTDNSKIVNNFSSEEMPSVLGLSTDTRNTLIKPMTFVSFSYSLLTILSVLIKMIFIYGKGKKILPRFLYPS